MSQMHLNINTFFHLIPFKLKNCVPFPCTIHFFDLDQLSRLQAMDPALIYTSKEEDVTFQFTLKHMMR